MCSRTRQNCIIYRFSVTKFLMFLSTSSVAIITLPIGTTVNRSQTNGGPLHGPVVNTVPYPLSLGARKPSSCCRFSSRSSATLVRSSPACGNARTNGNPGGGSQLVDNQAQVSPADLPILRVGIECTLTQLLDKGFLHAVRFHGVLVR